MQNINVEHPEYIARTAMYRKYRDLYAGGEQIRANASDYLDRRQKEPWDVYGERLNKVFYENYIGSIIDWYAATLFRREPQLHAEGTNDAGRSFFSEFTEDCYLKGTSISDFFRRRLVDTLVYGGSLILIDFPRISMTASSRAEEEALGASRAYLVDYTPENLINWSVDTRGNFEWVVLRSKYLRKLLPEDPTPVEETIWAYYDQTTYRLYRGVAENGRYSTIELIDSGRHAMANQSRVPVIEMKVSDGLWLMNKAGSLQLEHFNKSNALSWALTMGLFAAPVVYSERDFNQIIGESYFIQLGPNDRFGWTEPEGNVFQIAAQNLSRLQEEIYRVCYLMTQAGGNQSSAATQSGLSKQRDFAITQEVLRAYGDAVKDTMKRTLRWIEAAREDALMIDVSGLDEFDISDFSDLQDAQTLLSLGIDSHTLRKQVYKKLAFKFLCDVRQEVKDQIAREIDASLGS